MRRLRFDHLLCVASLVWVGLLANQSPLAADSVCLWATGGLIGLNFAVSLVQLIRKGRVLVLLNIAQLPLFCVLSYQVFSTLGPGHYQYTTEPGLWDWIELSAVHFLRAVDVLDALGAYGIQLQNVQHASALSGLILIGMHLVVDVFLISLIFRCIAAAWKRKERSSPSSKRLRRQIQRRKSRRRAVLATAVQLLALGLCGGLVVRLGLMQHWRPLDWLLWPLDNALRTLDVADVFQIFDWCLHKVDMGFWTVSLAVALRFIVGIYVAAWINYVRVAGFGGLGATVEELVDSLDDTEYNVRENAARALGRLGPDAQDALPALIKALDDASPMVRVAAIHAVGQMEPAAEIALPAFEKTLDDGETLVRRTVPPALAKLGSEAVPMLVAALGHHDESVREGAITALGSLGQSALPALSCTMDNANARTRSSAVRAMGEIGAAAVSSLVKTLDDVSATVRAVAADALGRIGPVAREALTQLHQIVQHDNDRQCREAAARALSRIDR